MNAVVLLLALVATTTAVQSACVSTTLTVDQKLELNADANDPNSDGQITGQDIASDLSNNYDSDNDGTVTEAEWVDRWTCAFGDTKFYARYVWSDVSQGQPSIKASDFAAQSLSIPRAAFVDANRRRYERFQNNSCVNRELTLDEKLKNIARDNDFNNDGVVTTADIIHDINVNYEVNGDWNLTKAEFVLRWVCAYGDSAAFAQFVWNDLTHGGSGAITNSEFEGPPFNTGVPLANFLANNRRRYDEYAKLTQGSNTASFGRANDAFTLLVLVQAAYMSL